MKVYMCSDLHGNGELFDQVLNFIDDSDIPVQIYFLGDAADRGRDGYRIMKWMLANPDVFVYIKGNHEDLFVRSAEEFLNMCKEEGYKPWELAERFNYSAPMIMDYGIDMRLHYLNGGASTFEAWLKDGCPTKIIRQLKALPIWKRVGVSHCDKDIVIYDMCHAGCLEQEWVNKEEDALLWDRNHFFQKWNYKDEEGEPQHILVHGHTAVKRLPAFLLKEAGARNSTWKPCLYNEGTKMCLDTRTIETEVFTLVELQTHEMVHFATETSTFASVLNSLN